MHHCWIIWTRKLRKKLSYLMKKKVFIHQDNAPPHSPTIVTAKLFELCHEILLLPLLTRLSTFGLLSVSKKERQRDVCAFVLFLWAYLKVWLLVLKLAPKYHSGCNLFNDLFFKYVKHKFFLRSKVRSIMISSICIALLYKGGMICLLYTSRCV